MSFLILKSHPNENNDKTTQELAKKKGKKVDGQMTISEYYQKLSQGIVVTIGSHDTKLKLSRDYQFLMWRTPYLGFYYGSINKSKWQYANTY